MPQRKSGLKDLRKNWRRNQHNLDIKSDLKRTVKKYLKSIQGKQKEEASSLLKLVYKKFDKAAKHNIIEKNTASRRKSRFSRLLASIA